MPDDLEERLKSHARAFDGLLSLIPAKTYYGEDNSDQWQRKKQTKEQKRAARIAKLDPDNAKTAKDVLDERAAVAATKRKREESDLVDSTGDLDVNAEKPMKGQPTPKKQKKSKENQSVAPPKESGTSTQDAAEEKRRRKAEKKAAKRERKKTQLEKAKTKRERQKARRMEEVANEVRKDEDDKEEDGSDDEGSDDGEEMAEAIDIEPTLKPKEMDEASSASPSVDASPHFDSPLNHSTSSSVSSIQPPATIRSEVEKAKSTTTSNTQSKPSPDEIRARLTARIEALRAARKADGPNGQPARSRQELLEARRKKEEERRAHKKELRRKAKEEEARKQDEEIARRFSPGGSGSLLASPRSPMAESSNSFSFGRVAFNDGTEADTSLSTLLDPNARKKKGPSDVRSQLSVAEQKAARLSGLDPAKRAEIEQKDMWLNARKRAHGEKVKDDTSLLKKALKRQEGKKGKSEKEWRERNESVEKGIQARQKKRDDNLKKRKDERNAPGHGKKGKVKRPGFEGSFRAKHGNAAAGKK